MKVAYLVSDQTACTWYRVVQPIQMAVREKALAARPIYERENPVVASQLINVADLLVMSRATDERLAEVIVGYQKQGKRVIMDHDDNMFACSPLSPHYDELGTENYFHELNGTKIPIWQDGKKDFSIERNKKRLASIKNLCSLVDAVSVTTPRLGNVFRPFSNAIHVLPNCVDLSVWKKLPLIRTSSEIRMGWSGGASHYEDWLVIAAVLPEIMDIYPNLKLVITGQRFDGTLKGVPKERIEHHHWTHLQAHPYKQSTLDLDFAIIPLKDSEFNSGKSSIKWVEYGALQVPAVTSHVAPYDEVADLVKENGIFVDNTHEAWIQGLSIMIENAEMRKVMGQRARKTVEEHFDASLKYPLWVSAFNQTLAFEPRQVKEKEGVPA